MSEALTNAIYAGLADVEEKPRGHLGAFEMKERVVLSSLELEMAKMVGMTPEEYGKGKLHLAGCKDERERIVAWLRGAGYRQIADAIEAEEHLG